MSNNGDQSESKRSPTKEAQKAHYLELTQSKQLPDNSMAEKEAIGAVFYILLYHKISIGISYR